MKDAHEHTIDIDTDTASVEVASTEHTVDFEPEDELGATGAVAAKLKKVREELVTAQKERNENLDGWQRAKADLVNFRREAMQSTDRAVARTKEGMIEDIIPVLDSFDMAMGGSSWEAVDSNWRHGVEQIRNQLLEVLTRNNVERYGAIGDVFNHAIHEAIQEVEEAEGESGIVVRVGRAGYKSGDRIIRPAQVIVKK